VPVVGHDAVGENANGGHGFLGEGETTLEGFVVLAGAEECHLADTAVEDVLDDVAGAMRAVRGMGGSVTGDGPLGKEIQVVPF